MVSVVAGRLLRSAGSRRLLRRRRCRLPRRLRLRRCLGGRALQTGSQLGGDAVACGALQRRLPRNLRSTVVRSLIVLLAPGFLVPVGPAELALRLGGRLRNGADLWRLVRDRSVPLGKRLDALSGVILLRERVGVGGRVGGCLLTLLLGLPLPWAHIGASPVEDCLQLVCKRLPPLRRRHSWRDDLINHRQHRLGLRRRLHLYGPRGILLRRVPGAAAKRTAPIRVRAKLGYRRAAGLRTAARVASVGGIALRVVAAVLPRPRSHVDLYGLRGGGAVLVGLWRDRARAH
mmetsp:Transcript_23072/g.57962  ORF Transcript_23072/g.57962 Transcript_23072/m.57962 type:complete len:289 (+) Transcript_23072:1247-2113(+)